MREEKGTAERDRAALEKEVIARVAAQLGAIANPARVYFVNQLPKTRSGKVLRRSIQALAEGRDGSELAYAQALADWFPGHADYLDSALAQWMAKRNRTTI